MKEKGYIVYKIDSDDGRGGGRFLYPSGEPYWGNHSFSGVFKVETARKFVNRLGEEWNLEQSDRPLTRYFKDKKTEETVFIYGSGNTYRYKKLKKLKWSKGILANCDDVYDFENTESEPDEYDYLIGD